MILHSFANFKLMSRHRKELRGALGHGLCVNPSLTAVSFNNISTLQYVKIKIQYFGKLKEPRFGRPWYIRFE